MKVWDDFLMLPNSSARLVATTLPIRMRFRCLFSLSFSKQYRKALDLARKICDDKLTRPPRPVVGVEAEILSYVGDVRAAVLRHRELCSREDSVPE